MKKRLVSIVVGLLVLGMGGNVWAGNVVAADLNCTNPAGCVQANEISDGVVAEPKIAAGAVTDVKITGPISASKLEKPANVIVVAQSGGDFTSISAAIASLPDPNPTPVVIKVMPGSYSESITMKSNVHIQGADRDLVTIVPGMSYEGQGILFEGVSNATLSGLKIESWPYYTSTYTVILIRNSTAVRISDCAIYGHDHDGSYVVGINILDDSEANIENNVISGNQFGLLATNAVQVASNAITNNTHTGLYVNGSPDISNNTIKGNRYEGITINSGSPTIKSNIISGNGRYGIYFSNTSSLIAYNTLMDNQIDIVSAYPYGGSPTINFNTLNTYSGSNGRGKYNVDTTGNDVTIY